MFHTCIVSTVSPIHYTIVSTVITNKSNIVVITVDKMEGRGKGYVPIYSFISW